MRWANFKNTGKIIGFLSILCLCICFFTNTSLAQNLSAQQIAQLAKNGNYTNAGQALAKQANIPVSDARNFVQKFQSNNIDIGSATNFISGALNGKINAANISSATSMLGKLQSGQANLSAISNLSKQISSGNLPVNIGESLSKITNLGNISNLGSLADVFKQSSITKGLSDQLTKGLSATKIADTIGAIGGIVSDPKAFAQQAIAQAAGQAISQAIAQAAPQLASALNSALGGAGGLSGAISSALGAQAGGTQTPTQPGGGGDSSGGGGCSGCNCNTCIEKINQNHNTIKAHTTAEFEQHRNWLVGDFYLDYFAPSLMRMTSAFVTNMMLQVEIIGTFFDAKHQLETQRLIQQMTAQAHKDYHPSKGLCEIGTNTRSLAASERRSTLSHQVFAKRMMDRLTLSGDGVSYDGGESDRKSRLDLFIKKFCNKTDHGGGLLKLCKEGGTSKKQLNMDVDFTSSFENKLTLDVDFTDERSGPATEDEENLFALSANLFANELPDAISEERLANNSNEPYALADKYLDLRAIAAKRSVAQNSFSAITGMKVKGDKEVAPFLKAILQEAGIKPEDIEERLGENPSYFAQMEVLTKDLYQNPNFYANLYDKPTNIERKGAALQAIELIQDRDIYQSLIRSEAVLATMVEALLRKEHSRISRELDSPSSSNETMPRRGG